ncbi:hypothetical protein [Chryseobacterium polytrichastri]|uniref:Uncharacterized protein n=1 Tax=Chryseobacterium polytrichastri TaxID=1302687 RepID=A0A1M6TML6_9FLAO|nr:hypothetical protein [Chryseobacterium polytrichastri]SHK58184.1 hypothetical protein SAMN05444267_1005144 [Chryseobacterium polytrichastri]
MKKKLIVISLFYCVCLSAQVGINTPTPTATLDVVSSTAVPTNKILNIQNSNASNANNITVYEDSRSYIGKSDNITPDVTNDALVNLYGRTDRSNLKLDNVPSTQNQRAGVARPGVDYNHLSPAYIDVNGHVVKAYDPFSNTVTASNFDGVYVTPNSTAGISIVDMPAFGLATFKVSSALVFGTAGVGSNILATVNFGINTGFSYSNAIAGSGSGSTRYPMTVTTTSNNNSSVASYTADITFSFPSGANLVFFYQNGSIFARNTGSGNIPISIMESKRYR